MFLKSFKIKYKELSEAFLNEQVMGDYFNDLSDKSKDTIAMFRGGETITKPQWYKLRKEVAKLHWNKHLEYITSPGSETYMSS